MKTRSQRPFPGTSDTTDISSAGSSNMDLATARLELDAALERMKAEIELRRKAEVEFERLFSSERERIRKQLHDGLGQALTSVSFLASGLRARLRASGVTDAPELDEIILLINQAVAESRALAAGFEKKPSIAKAYSSAV